MKPIPVVLLALSALLAWAISGEMNSEAQTVEQRINELCRSRWPNDFEMREYCITEQAAAAIRLGELSPSSRLVRNAGRGPGCDLPALPVIPPREKVGDNGPEIRAASATYFEGMLAYTQCIQDLLLAAGGESAPPSVKSILVKRNNDAVTEAEAVLKIFTTSLGPIN